MPPSNDIAATFNSFSRFDVDLLSSTCQPRLGGIRAGLRAEDHPSRQLKSIYVGRAITGTADGSEGSRDHGTQYHLARLFLCVEPDGF